MAKLIGSGAGVVGGALATVDAAGSQRNPLGMRSFDENGNEYVYLQGVASTIVGSWIVYPSSSFVTILGVTGGTAIGKVAVATAAVGALAFGWYMIYGLATGSVATGGAGGKVWFTATPGRVDNTDVAVELITGAIQVGATALNLATFDLCYPFAHHEVLN